MSSSGSTGPAPTSIVTAGEAREIRGLSVQEHINRLSQDLIPLAERCARTMREALADLETLRSVPSPVVERSRPIAISRSGWISPVVT